VRQRCDGTAKERCEKKGENMKRKRTIKRIRIEEIQKKNTEGIYKSINGVVTLGTREKMYNRRKGDENRRGRRQEIGEVEKRRRKFIFRFIIYIIYIYILLFYYIIILLYYYIIILLYLYTLYFIYYYIYCYILLYLCYIYMLLYTFILFYIIIYLSYYLFI